MNAIHARSQLRYWPTLMRNSYRSTRLGTHPDPRTRRPGRLHRSGRRHWRRTLTSAILTRVLDRGRGSSQVFIAPAMSPDAGHA